MRWFIGAFVALSWFGMVSSPVAAQENAENPAFTFRDSTGVATVLAPALVQKGNRWIKDLKQRDFRLFVDERPIPIEFFESDSRASMSLILLQDLSGSMANAGKLELSKKAFQSFLRSSTAADEWALATFAGGQTRVEVPFTQEHEIFSEAMDLWEGYGTTGLHDAIAWLPDVSESGKRSKRAVILITDGADNASLISPDEARSMVRRSKLPVYVLGLQTREILDQDAAEATFKYFHLLQSLASSTGGRYHAIIDENDLFLACRSIIEDLSNQYVLGFSVADSGFQRYRQIRVEVRGKRNKVSHREGYSGGRPIVRPLH